MAKLTLVTTARANTNLVAHRASATEGEAAKKLLEAQGFTLKGPHSRQYQLRCPFHEGPGNLERGQSVKFYMDADSSLYYCQAASCGEKGNLQTLERFFGVDGEDDWLVKFKSKDTCLKEFQLNLTTSLRQPFYEHGLTDATIDRFRLGYEPEHQTDSGTTIPGRYVIPYLEQRRPRFFRYYDPNPATNQGGKFKYTWEQGAESALFNVGDAVGDPQTGIVFLTEGEQKAMLLVQMGYTAVAVPGAGQWKDEFQAAFTHAKKIVVVYDNDNPEHPDNHLDKDGRTCVSCENRGFTGCIGHNHGQIAALRRVEQIGWRAKNLVLPLPEGEPVKKTDINDFFMRDGHTNADFAELATGKRATPYIVQSLADIVAAPPEESEFLIEQGILSKGGRLLIAGKPKVGKSLFVNNLALALASGLRFLAAGSHHGFAVDHPTRTLLLDRELSKRSLFERFQAFTTARPAFKAAEENLLIDHDHLIRLDQPNAYDVLSQLVEQNGAEVCILDTAYKFFGGDVESSSSLMKAFGVLDRVIHETGCAFVLTHHIRKSSGGSNSGKQAMDYADPEGVAGSFLWTGWPNATILLNFKDRSVENPFNSVATFTAFRDSAPPDPLVLYRDRTSITYTAIDRHFYEEDNSSTNRKVQVIKPTTDLVANLLLEVAPCTEEDFLHMAAGKFGVSIQTVKPYYLDALMTGEFEKTKTKPPIIKFKGDVETESWESDHGLAERPIPAAAYGDPDLTYDAPFASMEMGDIL